MRIVYRKKVPGPAWYLVCAPSYLRIAQNATPTISYSTTVSPTFGFNCTCKWLERLFFRYWNRDQRLRKHHERRWRRRQHSSPILLNFLPIHVSELSTYTREAQLVSVEASISSSRLSPQSSSRMHRMCMSFLPYPVQYDYMALYCILYLLHTWCVATSYLWCGAVL